MHKRPGHHRFQSRICISGLDISADLRELGRTPVAVISAGVKSILDIGRTLEYLVRYHFGTLSFLLK